MVKDNSVEFYFRLFILDTGDGIMNVETFICDIDPMDRGCDPDSWVREHISYCWDEDWVRKNCNLPKEGSFQVIGKAKLRSNPYPIEEYDEETTVLESKHVPVPEGWWEWKCRNLSLRTESIDTSPT